MSHRSDIFGLQITARLEKLRDSAPPHSMKETEKEFERSFDKKIQDVF
jgi:predicted unusual protein kinase regulating ubiquinone biosynthesis (AarF/ABC1/UbiB family)